MRAVPATCSFPLHLSAPCLLPAALAASVAQRWTVGFNCGLRGFNGLEVIDDATGEKLPYSVKFSYDESTDTLNTDIASNGPTTRAGKITVRYWTFPLDYQHFYESSRIIERGGKYSITLQAYPKINAQWDFRMIAWDALVWRHIGNHVIHTSLGTIALFAVVNPCKDQFLCHVMAAGFLKTPWNLECQRPQVGLAETILAKCNPYYLVNRQVSGA